MPLEAKIFAARFVFAIGCCIESDPAEIIEFRWHSKSKFANLVMKYHVMNLFGVRREMGYYNYGTCVSS